MWLCHLVGDQWLLSKVPNYHQLQWPVNNHRIDEMPFIQSTSLSSNSVMLQTFKKSSSFFLAYISSSYNNPPQVSTPFYSSSWHGCRILQKLGWSKQERLRLVRWYNKLRRLTRYDDYKDPATGRKYIVDHQPHVEMAAFEKKIEPQPFIWRLQPTLRQEVIINILICFVWDILYCQSRKSQGIELQIQYEKGSQGQGEVPQLDLKRSR